MTFKLKLNDPMDQAIKNVVKEQIDEAISHLTHQPDDFGEAIHEMRLSCKRIRAILRLIRHVLDQGVYRYENQWFRTISKPYNDVRDAQVLLDTVELLKESYAQDILSGTIDEIEQIFLNRYRHITSQDHVLTATITRLKEGRQRLHAWTIYDKGWDIFGPGLKVTYHRSQQEFRKSLVFPSVRRLHEWRKQTKYLLYQLQLLRKTFPSAVKSRLKKYAQLGRLLGADHDLAILHHTILHPSFSANYQTKQLFLTMISIHSDQLKDEIFEIGHFLYQDTPKKFMQKIEKYWKS